MRLKVVLSTIIAKYADSTDSHIRYSAYAYTQAMRRGGCFECTVAYIEVLD
jgi:hypothetical protein